MTNALPPQLVEDFALVALTDPLVRRLLETYQRGEINSTTMLVASVVGLAKRSLELKAMMGEVMAARVKSDRGPSPVRTTLRDAFLGLPNGGM